MNSSMNAQAVPPPQGGQQAGEQMQPDPDAIKMFVGQIPRSMNEDELRKMFEEFGPVYQLNVLCDKVTGQSKGCCFITFYTRKAALDAQNELHNIKTMPGMQHAIQMKPADSEKRNAEERKLFVGMLSRKSSEQDVRMIFSPFGSIEECTILREQNGDSKGCAFLTFTNKQYAMNAIKSMHHSQTMEGCRHPLVVKFADTQKEKEMKKMQTMNANLLTNLGALGGLGALTPQYLALLQQALGNQQGMGNMGAGVNALQLQQLLTAAASAATALQNNPGLSGGINPSGLSALQQLLSAAQQQQPGASQNMSMQNPVSMGMSPSTPTNGAAAMGGYAQNSLSSAGATGGMAPMQPSNGIGGGPSNQGGGAGNAGAMETINQAYAGIQQYAGLSGLLNQASFPNAFNPQASMQQQTNTPAGKQTEGPDGANLFIYHLPQEFSDQDLLQMFSPFGNCVSAKVFIDKQTNLSKCFGFVSYDNPMSAQQAIQAMNGFQIGMKRLKVQLKRPKSDAKPY